MATRGNILIDESRRPLIHVSFEGPPSDAEFAAYLERMTRMLELRERTVVVLDGREAGRTPAKQRRMQAQWLDEQRETLREFSLGTAFVINSSVTRGILTAIFWVSPLETPHTIVATYEEAEDWAFERLREAGIEPPRSRDSAAS